MAVFDPHKNLAYSTIATAPAPASSGTSLVVFAGDGTRFPAVPFNATVWPANTQPTTANAEIVRVTNISTDTFTITRAQESSNARSIIVGDQIAATVTAKTLTDIENTLLLTQHGVLVGGGAAAGPVALAVGATGQYLAGSTGADPTWQSSSGLGAYVKLKSGSGTSVATGATDVDTYALASQLTANDTLIFLYTIEQTTNNVVTPRIRNTTDNVTILDLGAGLGLAAGHTMTGHVTVRQGQSAATVVLAQQSAFDGSGSGNYVFGNKATFSTVWTGAWTFGFGFASQSGPGTFAYSYSLFRVIG